MARLAGLPAEVIARAKEILAELEGTHSGGGEGLGRRGRHRPASQPPPDQLSFFQPEHPVLRRLRALDLDGITGGFNFQAAWTTGWLAGNAMAGQAGVRQI